MEAARFFINGRVQGVGFRASARRRAIELGLRGYARNLPDGRVEAFAQGDRPALDAFAQWLRHGPALARVDDLQCEQAEPEQMTGFGFG